MIIVNEQLQPLISHTRYDIRTVHSFIVVQQKKLQRCAAAGPVLTELITALLETPATTTVPWQRTEQTATTAIYAPRALYS